MTDYVNNRFINHMREWIRDKDWYKGQVISRAGKFPLGKLPNNQHYIQMDRLFGLGADIKISDTKAYPQSVITDMKSILRKVKWFNSLIDWTDAEYEDFTAGNDYEVEKTRVKIDNINYELDEHMETWGVGYGTTFTSDVDYDERWIPWMKLQTTASSTASNPGDMQDKVTNIAGTTGTTATELDMTTKLSSTTTNMTMNFAQNTFGPIIRAFLSFKDTYTGRRMVNPLAIGTNASFQCHIDPVAAWELQRIKVYDGEKLTNTTVAQDMASMGIEIVPNRQFSAAFAEEAGGGQGKIQFGFTADFANNFKIGVSEPVTWEADYEIPGINPKWVKKMHTRWTTYTHPYYDGSKWYKAFFAGYFDYMDDA